MTTSGTNGYLSYSNFRVGSADEQYKLTISGFSGVTSDPFSTHPLNGMKFTTKDRDNDLWSSTCALNEAGGWWYKHCSHMFPNHQYKNNRGIYLKAWIAFSSVEIKIKPVQCKNAF